MTIASSLVQELPLFIPKISDGKAAIGNSLLASIVLNYDLKKVADKRNNLQIKYPFHAIASLLLYAELKTLTHRSNMKITY